MYCVPEVCLLKPFLPQAAAVTDSARSLPALITRPGLFYRNAQFNGQPHNLRFTQMDERRLHMDTLALHTGLQSFGQHSLIGLNEIRPAIRIAGVVDRIGS